MAQIKVLPRHRPARYLNHISQAWKDSPCSPPDRWRWTSSREADKMGEKRKRYKEKLFCSVQDKGQTFCLRATTWARLLINPRCSCLRGVKSEGSCPLWPQANTEPTRVKDPGDPSGEIRRCIYFASWRFIWPTMSPSSWLDVVLWSFQTFSVWACFSGRPWKCYEAFALRLIQLWSLPPGVLEMGW